MANKSVSEKSVSELQRRWERLRPSHANVDVIVIGAGTIGLSATYYAAARGLKTVMIEQFASIANDKASSGGFSRMFRIMYAPAYMAQLAEVALAMWKEIETASGNEILWTQPLIFYGVSQNVLEGNIDEMKKVLTGLGVPYTWYPDPSGLLRDYPAFNKTTMPTNYIGLAQANSAVIRVPASIASFGELAHDAGAYFIMKQPATITGTAGPYQVTCRGATYTAPHLILCPGAWTNSLLRPFNQAEEIDQNGFGGAECALDPTLIVGERLSDDEDAGIEAGLHVGRRPDILHDGADVIVRRPSVIAGAERV